MYDCRGGNVWDLPLSPSTRWSLQLVFSVCLPHTLNCRIDSRIPKQREGSKIISVPSLGSWVHPAYSGLGESWGLRAEAPIVGAVGGYLLPWPGTWCSCSLNSERSHCTMCQGAGGGSPLAFIVGSFSFGKAPQMCRSTSLCFIFQHS